MTGELKIGLVGFFGFGNFGDELFIEAHRQYLGHLGVVEPINDLTKKPYFSEPIEQVVSRYDAFVIGGGDLMIPWAVSDLYWRKEYLARPVFVTGIGVPTWRSTVDKAVQRYRGFFLHENVKYVSARDAETRQWLIKNIAPITEPAWYPDLVCAMDLPEPVDSEGEKILGLVLRHRKGGRDDFSYVRSLCERAKMLGYTVEHIVLGSGEVGQRDFETASLFAEADEPILRSEDVSDMCRFISRCTMLASMKFHGTVVATMYGIPSVVMSPTDKSRNFLRMIERPDLKSSLSEKELRHRITKFPAPIGSFVQSQLRSLASKGYQELEQAIRMQFDAY